MHTDRLTPEALEELKRWLIRARPGWELPIEREHVRMLLAAAEREAGLRGWLRWRSDWTGSDAPTDHRTGEKWWTCAMRGDEPPKGY